MTGAPVGAVVRIFYDADPGQWIQRGDVIVTTSGRAYEVVVVQRQRRGVHVGRYHLTCTVLGYPEHPTPRMPGRRVHTLRWYPRSRARR